MLGAAATCSIAPAVVASPVVAHSSPAAIQSDWVRLTAANLPTLTQAGLAVSGSTVTVAWPYPPSPTGLDSAIDLESFAAKVGRKIASPSKPLVVARSSSIGDAVALVPEGGGELGLVFNDTSGTLLATGRPRGAFTAPALIGTPYSGTPSAVLSHGTLIVAEDGLLLDGMSASQAGVDYQQNLLGGCCGSEPQLGIDRSGRVWLAWYSDATGHVGIYLVQLDKATGSPVGKPMAVPDSATGDWNGQSRVDLVCAATCRVVYFTITQPANDSPIPHVMSWAPGKPPVQVAQLTPTLLALPCLAAAYLQNGKLVVAWYDRENSGPQQGYYAEVGNGAGTGGKPFYLGQPGAASAGSYTLEAAASGDKLVLLAIDGAVSGQAAAGWVDVVG
jgi:hypothetical protein